MKNICRIYVKEGNEDMFMDERTELDRRLTEVVPSKRQIEFQKTEFYAFVHFTVNTFTDKEWGDGTESPEIFNPYRFDPEQWVNAILSAGMKGLILTCKHHDGFCLWHSKYTKHTVLNSPFKRDIVLEVSEACRKHGLKFGVYLSPWDRNSRLYGQGKAYDDYFIDQLKELLTGYGEVFSVWFDGACGEGPNGKKQYYDWDRYYETIRKLQPGACISVCGPDVRWCGNEAGHTRKAEWSVVPLRTRDTEKIAENSQQEDSTEFRTREIHAWDGDLGSREILKNERDLVWYPAEVNTSIRPGWFWHRSEDDKVRPLDELINIYEKSVGGNATFLLNIPPTDEGLFHENDVKRLKEIGDYLKSTYTVNLIEQAVSVTGTDTYKTVADIKKSISEDTYEEYYRGNPGSSGADVTVSWEKPVDINRIVIKENILFSQRVEAFTVEALLDGKYQKVYEGTVIGYKRIVSLENVIKTDCIKIIITDSRLEPVISFIGVY